VTAGQEPAPGGALGVAVLGQGWWGRAVVRALAGSDKLRVVTTVDKPRVPAPNDAGSAVEFARAHGVGFTTDYAAALRDDAVEAVVLCTPHSQHTDQVARAAEAGKHVFCEKPLALTRREAAASIAVCAANGVVLGLGYEHRFKPPMIELARLVEAGELGRIMECEATFSTDVRGGATADNWRKSDAEAPCGPLTSTGIHALDLCVGVLGAPETVVASRRRNVRPAPADALSILMGFRNGADAVITALSGTPFSVRFAVFGDRGWVELRDKTHPENAEGWVVTTCMRGGAMEIVDWPAATPVLAGLEAFADAARGRMPYPISHDEMLATVAALEATVKSVESGRIEQVEV
jgi:predicted dehydrogenase